MNLLDLALNNLRRRPGRSLLTAAAIALGICAVVALTGIAWGFEASWQQANDDRGTDLILTRGGSENAMPVAFVGEPWSTRLRALPQVHEVAGLLSEMLGVDDGSSPVFVFGWQRGSYLWTHLQLVDGRWPEASDADAGARADELVIGSIAADLLHKSTGDLVDIEGRSMRIVGTFESPAMVENGALVMNLDRMQRLTDKPGKVNVLNLKLAPGAGAAELAAIKREVAATMPGFVAITSGELVRRNAIVRIAKAMGQATTLIASLVGALVVFNSMLMSVHERTREIGLLQALGWARRRVVALVVTEATLLALAGGVAGIGLGIAATVGLEHMDLMRGKIDAVYSTPFYVGVTALCVLIGVIGGLAPALKAARMRPAAALRREC
ncbi:MAG: ABC transporter permease [Burkholderiales bacterium]|nr:ABC transporter permease [Burkholderiales bacterium]